MSRVSARFGLSLLASIVLLGCGETGGPAVEYVEGVVTLDGKPIEGVNVSFSPTKPDAGTPAVGTTDANGVFKLTAVQGGKVGGGAGVGDYQVTFSKVKATGGMRTDVKPGDPDYGKESASARPGPSKIEYEVPQKYENAATSGFTAKVEKGTNKGDKFKFDLTSK
jgi:hypothetical protein